MKLFRRIWSSLYFKISVVFALLMCILGILLSIIAVVVAVEGRGKIDQMATRQVAQHVAQQLQPSLTPAQNEGAVQKFFATFQKFNPKSQLFVLDKEGRVLISSPSESELLREQVDTTPIEQFLSADWSTPQYIIGDDPRAESGQHLFSVAPIQIGESPGYIYVMFTRPELELEFQQKILGLLAGSWLIGLILAIPGTMFVGLVLFFFVTRRFRRLKRVVQGFQSGDLSRRFKAKSYDEVSQLGRVFNEMADAIESNIEELKENDRERRALIANVSHDLRTPLTTIQGFLEMILLEQREGLDEKTLRFLETIHEEVESLGTMVSELFELSKYDAKGFEPKLEPFSGSMLAQDIVEKFQPKASDHYIKLTASADDDLSYVLADFDMIERALNNLVVNAMHATPPGGSVTVSVRQKQDVIEFEVSDTGTGIPEEDIPHVFDRFFRVQKARTRKYGGSGLGLAIVKSIIDAHESEVLLKSASGKGSSFRFSLRIFTPEQSETHAAP